MSVHVSSWAWKQDVGDDGAKLVLLKLADSANDDGVAWPKRDTLLLECEAGHEDTVKRRLRKLRDAGLIISVPWNDANGRQTSSMYVLPHRGVPSAERLWEIVEQANRKGSVAITREQLLAAEAVGAFIRGGASVHPLNPVSGGASTHPTGGAPTHPSIEEPSVEPSTRANALVPDTPGEEEFDERKYEIQLALSATLNLKPSGMPRGERGAWESAIAQLADVDATAEQVTGRCRAYRAIWPDARLTPLALVKHWSMLGLEVETGAADDPVAAWVEKAPALFDRMTAHELLDDRVGVNDATRSTHRARLDELFDERDRRAA